MASMILIASAMGKVEFAGIQNFISGFLFLSDRILRSLSAWPSRSKRLLRRTPMWFFCLYPVSNCDIVIKVSKIFQGSQREKRISRSNRENLGYLACDENRQN